MDALGQSHPSVTLPYGVPASFSNPANPQPTDSVQSALNALFTNVHPGGSVTVTQSGNIYTMVFGGNLTGLDPATFLSASAAGGVSLTVDGTSAPLKVLSSDVAHVATSGPPNGTFTLSVKGQATVPLPFGVPASYSNPANPQPTDSVQSALNALLATAYPGAVATVTQAGSVTNSVLVTQAANVYTISFTGGTPNLLGVDPAAFLTGANSGPALATFTAASGVITIAYNGVTAIAPNTTLNYNSSSTTAANLQTYLSNIPGLTAPGAVTVTGNVGGPFNISLGAGLNTNLLGVLNGPCTINGMTVKVSENFATDDLWRGPVSLNTDSVIDVAYNSRLTLFGAIDDNAAPAAGGAGFAKTGLGELVLGGASTYRGVTNINQGLVTLENGQALGSPVGGTVVANGATLQLQGNITVAGEPLTLLGPGLGQAPTNVPVQWFSAGPAPINNGNTIGNMPVTGRVTGIATDPTDNNVMYISTAGGGAWKTVDNGLSWHSLFDNTSEVQFTATGAAGTFNLTLNGPGPDGLIGTADDVPATTVDLPANATAAQVAAALNALPTIGGVGGSVTVVATPIIQPAPGGMLYTITYGGTLSGNAPPPMTATGTGGTVTSAAANFSPAMFSGAIAIAPTDPHILYLGTGEANNSTDSYYGTGVYKSTDSGRTWTLLIDPSAAVQNPLYGLAVSSIAVDPRNQDRIFVATSNEHVATPPALAVAPVPGVYRYDGIPDPVTRIAPNTWFNLTGVVSTNRATLAGGAGGAQLPPARTTISASASADSPWSTRPAGRSPTGPTLKSFMPINASTRSWVLPFSASPWANPHPLRH